jgi:transcriptional regulator with GAF, ATPase, and Fis domain
MLSYLVTKLIFAVYDKLYVSVDMELDTNEFFRNVTLRICGNLKIEEGLHACFQYLSNHLPADKVYLERHTDDFSGLHIVAVASKESGKKLDVLIPLSPELSVTLREWERMLLSGEFPSVEVINRSEDEPIAMHILHALGEPPSSYMGLPLIVEGRLVGGLGLIAEGDDRYTEHHARLFATLKEPFFVAMSNALQHDEVVKLKNRLADDNRYLNRELLKISGDEIIGADFGLRHVMKQVRQVAPTESPVLLTGETGVGKDVIANAIHMGSARREGPFIPVNCGAIADSLIDSELFGHEKGAFTGALARKRGRFERAHQGTIFLDEIGEMPLTAQVRLLRVLQNRDIERLGGTERIPVDIRILAATNRDLSEMMKAGQFREDLWFRLNVFPLNIPPLRERTKDIPALVQHFIERKSCELKLSHTPRLAPGAIDSLLGYSWPGNVRELENVIERAMILCQDQPLQFDLGRPARQDAALMPSDSAESTLLPLEEIVAKHIQCALEITHWKIHGEGGAGELLGINPNTLRNRMRKLGIPFKKYAKE